MPRRVVDSLALIVSRYEVPNFAFCRDRETARMAAAEDEVAHFDAIADRRTTGLLDLGASRVQWETQTYGTRTYNCCQFGEYRSYVPTVTAHNLHE